MTGAVTGDGYVPMPTEAQFLEAEAEAKRLWHARRPSTFSARRGLDDLNSKLTEYAGLYEEGDLPDQRYAVAASLIAIHDFLLGQGLSPLVLEPAFRPVDALNDQDNNRLDPMFAERKGKGGGRPATPQDQHTRIGTLAALAQFWLDTHPSEAKIEHRLAAAARRLRGPWFGNVTGKDLVKARIALSQVAVDHIVAQTARIVREFIDSAAVDYGYGGAFSIAIRQLNALPASTSLGNWGAKG